MNIEKYFAKQIVPVDSFDDSVKPNDEKHYEPEEHQSVAYDLEYSDQRKDDFNEIKREMADGKEAFRKPEGKEWQRPTSDKKRYVIVFCNVYLKFQAYTLKP